MKRRPLFAAACVAALVFLDATVAFADCKVNGRTYPVGTVVGSLVCTANGWAPRGR